MAGLSIVNGRVAKATDVSTATPFPAAKPTKKEDLNKILAEQTTNEIGERVKALSSNFSMPMVNSGITRDLDRCLHEIQKLAGNPEGFVLAIRLTIFLCNESYNIILRREIAHNLDNQSEEGHKQREVRKEWSSIASDAATDRLLVRPLEKPSLNDLNGMLNIKAQHASLESRRRYLADFDVTTFMTQSIDVLSRMVKSLDLMSMRTSCLLY